MAKIFEGKGEKRRLRAENDLGMTPITAGTLSTAKIRPCSQ